SIDKYDQYTLYSKLRDGVLINKADSGAAVLVKIDTGEILAVARAAGETAPLMLVGVVKMVPELPVDAVFPYLHLDRK
ncbi:hypothetical protein HZD82_28055, partial [Pantoea agglomerans]|uniref:hypothetical protein n=1 Tax=Enterobacter agglomerans TaxID=549 RepID=UPI001A8C7788